MKNRLFNPLTLRALLIVLSIFFTTVTSQYSIANDVGNGGTGGGMVIVCPNGSVYLADTYNVIDTLILKGITDIDSYQVQVAITQVLLKKYPAKIYPSPDDPSNKVDIATMLDDIRKKIKINFTNNDLKLLGDDYIDENRLNGCKKVQIAIQKIKISEVEINKTLYLKLSSLERGLLDFHELLINLRSKPGLNTTEIRNQIEDIMKNELSLFETIMRSLNVDCHLNVYKFKLKSQCTKGDESQSDSDVCPRWSRGETLGHSTFIKSEDNKYEVIDRKNKIKSTVEFDGSSSVKLTYETPIGVSIFTNLKTQNNKEIFNLPTLYSLNTETIYSQISESEPLEASVSCTFGISKIIETANHVEKMQMDQMGPSPEWKDPKAPSLAQLPIGTIFELVNNLVIDFNKDGHARDYIVESQMKNMDDVELMAIPLYKRFAVAQIISPMNGFLSPISFVKGTKLELARIKEGQYVDYRNIGYVGKEYLLEFRVHSSEQKAASATISKMRIYGRRSGSADVKIPQMEELLKYYFQVTLPSTMKDRSILQQNSSVSK